MMDSTNKEFDNSELDDYMFKEFIDSLDSDIIDDEDADMMVMMSIHEEIEKRSLFSTSRVR